MELRQLRLTAAAKISENTTIQIVVPSSVGIRLPVQGLPLDNAIKSAMKFVISFDGEPRPQSSFARYFVHHILLYMYVCMCIYLRYLYRGAPQAPFIGALCGALYLCGATINFYIQAGAGRRKLSQTAPRVWGLGRCSPKKSIACSPPLLHRYALFSDLGESSDTI